MGGGDHLLCRSAAAIAPAERSQRRVRRALLREQSLGPGQFEPGELPVVVGDRRKVREDAAAVEALPEKAVVRKDVRVVPGQLLGEEPAAAGRPHDLRQRRRVAERIGQPDLERFHAECGQEEVLAGHELPTRQRRDKDGDRSLGPNFSNVARQILGKFGSKIGGPARFARLVVVPELDQDIGLDVSGGGHLGQGDVPRALCPIIAGAASTAREVQAGDKGHHVVGAESPAPAAAALRRGIADQYDLAGANGPCGFRRG